MPDKKLASPRPQKQKGSQKETGEMINRYTRARQAANEFLGHVATWQSKEGCPSELGLSVKEKRQLRATAQCGSYLWFREYYTIGAVKLASADFCKKFLLCPFCAIRRQTVNIAKNMPKLRQLIAETGLQPYLLTLTIKDGEDLRERVDHLKSSWAAMVQRRRNNKKGLCTSALEDIEGGIKSIEVKRGSRSGMWHPHLHQVVLAKPGALPDTSGMIGNEKAATELSKEWASITGDSFIVDCRQLRASDDDEMIKSLSEVFKYALKFADLSNEDRFTAWRSMSGVRLIDSWGCCRGVAVDHELTDDLQELKKLPYVEKVFRWLYESGGGYALSRLGHVNEAKELDVQYRDEAAPDDWIGKNKR